jgi:hypothetical protein
MRALVFDRFGGPEVSHRSQQEIASLMRPRRSCKGSPRNTSSTTATS